MARAGTNFAQAKKKNTTNCGKIIDYSDFIDEEKELIKKVEKNLARKYNFLVQDHIIEFYGLCKDCK